MQLQSEEEFLLLDTVLYLENLSALIVMPISTQKDMLSFTVLSTFMEMVLFLWESY